MRKADPTSDPTSIGNILIELGMAKPEDIDAARELQERRAPMGELLVAMRRITEGQLEAALIEQRARRGEISKNEVRAFRRRLASSMAEEAHAASLLLQELAQ